jgi:GDPmannose 4,6-dehydratase
VRVDEKYYRPAEVETLLGDPSKARDELGWVPEISLDEMILEMMLSDMEAAKKNAFLQHHGYEVPIHRGE